MDAETVDWFAGYFDAKAVIGRKVRYGRVSVKIRLTDGNRTGLDLFRIRYGGTVSKHHGDIWRWEVLGIKAEDLLFELLPKLLIKTARATQALDDPLALEDSTRGSL